MAEYDFGASYDAIEAFIETLSGWYLRLSRSKAWGSGHSPAKAACYEVLHLSLDAVARLLAPFMPFVAEALYQALGSEQSVHLADWPDARPDWTDDALAGEMKDVRRIVKLAREVRERLGIRHRHPLHTLQIAGVDASVIATHGELLKQEVNVKRVEVLPDPERHVKTILRLNTPVLGKRLKSRLQELQLAIGAGDYVINADETLSCQGMTLNPSEYFCHREAVDSNSPVAAEGTLVVLLDSTRDEELRLEADARDLNRTIQDLRKRARLAYADRIMLSIAGSGLDPLLTEFGPWLKDQALATELTTNLAEPEARATARLSTGDAHVAIRRVGPATQLVKPTATTR
jgi:isoleucyl-tRNA synthetase